jgi:predicted permease
MSMISGLRHILWTVLHRSRADEETREELAFHIARQTQKHIDAGVPPDEARRRAVLELGGLDRWREETSDTRRGRFLEDLAADSRYAIRGLLNRPGFALSAISTLAIGIGATTATFSLVDGALLRPLPFRDANHIMDISLRMPIQPSSVVDMVWSYPKFVAFRDRQQVFSSLALHSSETLVISDGDGAERMSGELASATYFDILGVTPTRGRVYTADEDRIGGPNAVVLVSDDLWRNRFAASDSAIGRTLIIGGVKHSIIGVMPPGFGGLSGDAQFWIPVPAARSEAVLREATAHNMRLVGRLRNAVSIAAAKLAVVSLGREIDEAFPSDDGRWGAAAKTLGEIRTNPSIRRSLQLLTVAVALLLAIVCVNLVTLVLTRGAARRPELAVRLALGSSRTRLVRQLLTESVVLSIVGGLAGFFIAVAATRLLAASLPLSMPSSGIALDLTRLTFTGIHVDARAFAFALALTGAIGMLAGVAMALRVTGRSLIASLRQGSVSNGGSEGRRSRAIMGSVLVAAQVALAFAFLVGSWLTIQSLSHTLAIPLGYDPAHLLTARLTLDPVRAQSESTAVLWRAVTDEVRSIPGVKSVALANCSPIGMHCEGTSITPDGHVGAAHVMIVAVSPEYFSTLGTPVVRGREFARTDGSPAPPVAIINRAAARTIWGSDDPLVTPVRNGERSTQIVGIVEDARYSDLERPAEPAIFVLFRGSRGVLFIRGDGDPAALIPGVRKAIRRAGAGHATGQIQVMAERLREATIRNRLSAQIFTSFAISALLLAAVGVYGTLALRVAQRSREFAIRRALGASTRSLARMVGAQATLLTIVGGSAGALLAIALNRGLAALLYDVRPLEPQAYLLSALLLIVVIAAAAARPTARSVRIDPREAMRAE